MAAVVPASIEASRLVGAQALRLQFAAPLLQGRLLSRPNRFVMEVRVDGEVCLCHAPATGKIAGFAYKEMAGLEMPCLVSRPKQPGNRKTQYTVEALSLSHPDEEAKAWFGINQSASTRYIGHFMSLGAFPEIAAQPGLVQAERKVGTARIDFVYDKRDLIEVKTPIGRVPVHTSTNPLVLQALAHRQKPRVSNTPQAHRIARHLDVMVQELEDQRKLLEAATQLHREQDAQGQPRAIMVQSYMYDAEPFQRPANPPTTYIGLAVERARLAGVELWQVNMALDPEGITLLKHFPIPDFGGAPVLSASV